MSKVGEAGFTSIRYRGKEIKGFTTTSTVTIIMQKNNPDRLDMRYKCNRKFIAEMRESKSKQPIGVGLGRNEVMLFTDDSWIKFG